MPRKPDERIGQAKEMFLAGMKLIEIAKELDLPEGTIRSWKNRQKWNCNVAKRESNVAKRKRGGQPGNHNATGPPGNHNAEKHGLFRKYLPPETFSIIQEMPKDSLDVLWDQIQIAYAAIIRAQQIMYVRDRDDKTTTKIGESVGDASCSEKWEVQQAWDKQATFLKSQARAQSELRSLIRQYDEMLHKNWELATQEQKARIDVMRAKANLNEEEETADDGFLEALAGTAAEDWTDEEN